MDPVQQLSQTKITYENGKMKHNKWLQENQEMVGTAEYTDYVEKFKQWEEQMVGSIKQLEISIKVS
jgi:post-segregation antitoxin (ccd killing protein)